MKVSIRPMLIACGSLLALATSAPAWAVNGVVYEDLATNLVIPPNNISWHNANGPVIADDFIPTASGTVRHLTWWGSQADSQNFEVVLQNNNPALGEPALTPAGNIATGGLKQIVTAVMTSYSIPGIYQFDADIAGGWNIEIGNDYWLTVANLMNNWQWAEALNGPTVGSELFNAHLSTGPGCLDGGPHCGPWSDIHTDLAFRIAAVPEPASWAMMLAGFGVIGAAMRSRRSAKVTFA